MPLRKRLTVVGAMALLLFAGCTSRNTDSSYAREEREREWALHTLAEAPAVQRPLMPLLSEADADWIARVRVDVGAGSRSTYPCNTCQMTC